jgi:hypothetical protein
MKGLTQATLKLLFWHRLKILRQYCQLSPLSIDWLHGCCLERSRLVDERGHRHERSVLEFHLHWKAHTKPDERPKGENTTNEDAP